ncbi:MAG: tripartite tricarboxylate transporter substrate-binding protein [Burkholderiales bacterium]
MKNFVTAVLSISLANTVFAQTTNPVAKPDAAPNYPNKPVRWVVPFTPGASNDIIGRLIAGKLTDSLGQTFVIDNRGGAGGLIGGETVARAQPDGYTLILANPGPSVNAPLMSRNAPYKPDDFLSVIYIGYAPLILLTNLNFPPRTPKELIDYAKANPNKVNWGSSGIGSSLHIGLAVLQGATGVQMTHVPYKGTAPLLTDLVGGQLQGTHTTTVSGESVIKGKRVRVVGIASLKRSPLLPDVPTLAENGIKDAEAVVWFGMAAPLKTPKPIIDKLNREINRILTLADVKARLDQLGLEVQGGTPEFMDNFVRGETAKLNKLIKAGLLKAD